MTRLFGVLTGLVLLLGSVGQAKADVFDFTFSAPSGAGYGTVTASDSSLGDGSLLATSGTLTITSGSAAGTYSLIPDGPGVTPSANGFHVDDLIYPANNAASGVDPGTLNGNPSYLTNWGLLFGSGGVEVNLFGRGSGDYWFAVGTSSTNRSIYEKGATFTLAPAPEPTSLLLFGLSTLAGAAYAGWQRRKQDVTA